MAHSGYREAYEQACKIAQELVEENHLPVSAISVLGRDPRQGSTMLQACEEFRYHVKRAWFCSALSPFSETTTAHDHGRESGCPAPFLSPS